MKDVLVDQAYAAGWRLVRFAPAPVAHTFFQGLADQAWRRRGRGVRQLERNLMRVVGAADPDDVRALSREGMRSYFRYWCDAFRLPSMSTESIRTGTSIDGIDALMTAVEEGGAVAAFPHMGNWDMAAAWALTAHREPLRGVITTVAERVEPESLFQRFVAAREPFGIEILPTRGAGQLLPTLIERVADGGLVALVADRDFSRTGIPVQFFGETALFPGGPAAIAVETGRPLFAGGLWYGPDGGGRGEIVGPIEVPRSGSVDSRVTRATQRMAEAFEEQIAAHPGDWHMLQRIWETDRGVRL